MPSIKKKGSKPKPTWKDLQNGWARIRQKRQYTTTLIIHGEARNDNAITSGEVRSCRHNGRTTVRLLLVAITALFFVSCKETPTSIETLLGDPGRFNGKTVRIVGEVKGSVGALGYGAYQVTDGTGTIHVVTQTGGVPREGTRVGVEGTLRTAFSLGDQSATVLVEQRRYTP
ncbi:MAG: hypothetical protein O3A57_11910 [Bacteroidetes bacterium]|nr:hypothetical protein [Bacteroidota bacterium]